MANFIFNVTLSNPSSQPISVNFTTDPDTATEGVDYADNSGVVNFPANSVLQTITVLVTGETAFEPSETFFVNLSGATNATILDNQGLGTILNDDGAIADLSINKTGPPSVGFGQNVNYTITVTNNGPQSASNVVVTDTIPAGTTFVSATPSQGSCSGTTTVTCTLGAIANGGTATIALIVTAPNGPATLTNAATVTNTPETDPTPGNNAGTAITASASVGEIPTLSTLALLALLGALLALAVMKI